MDYHAKYLNLPHRTDRYEHMVVQLSRTSLKAERHTAKLPSQVDQYNPKYATMQRRTPGAIPCHIGQCEIMREALAFGKNAIVMEDDIVFCEDFDKRFEYVENWMALNEGWDIFWLGSSFHVNPPFWHRVGGSGMPPDCSANLGYDAKRTSDDRIIQTLGAFATFAYIVNVNSIEKILGLFESHIHESIGIDWLAVKLQPQLKCFAFLPGMVKQKDNQSDIGTGQTIWSGFLKLNGTLENSAYVYQNLMTDFEPSTFNFAECR